MSRHTISHADQFFAGAALSPALGVRGLPAMLPTVEYVPLVTVSTTAICLGQQRTGAGPLLLNGAVGGADAGYASGITLTSAGNLSTLTFTIRGRDANGYPQAATIAGPNANTVTVLKTFRKIDSIEVSGTVGTNVSVGRNAVVGLKAKHLYEAIIAFDDGVLNATPTVVNGVTATQTATNGDARPTVLGTDTESLTVVYFPDRTKDGLGVNFVLPDQRVPSVQ